MLVINNLHVSVENKAILQGVSLTINPGEVHAIMGPNGSGKSTLSHVLAGREGYQVTSGQVMYQGKDLLQLSPEERSWAGIFLAFQYPITIPGVSNIYLLKAAFNAQRKARGEAELDAMDFMALLKEKMAIVDMDQDLIYRSVNDGFSGGEKKRNEILQMLVLNPSLAILDETDSGLDIDALRIVSEGVNIMRHEQRSFLLITHYQRLLDYIVPDHIHVLAEGRIVRSGGAELAHELESKGYSWLSDNPATSE